MSAAPEESVILVGRNDTSRYVIAVITQFQSGVKRVILRARGRSITRAVDAAELVKKLDPTIKDVSVKIGSETVGEPGKERTVSTIEIVLERKEE